jgi:hypothetical protein
MKKSEIGCSPLFPVGSICEFSNECRTCHRHQSFTQETIGDLRRCRFRRRRIEKVTHDLQPDEHLFSISIQLSIADRSQRRLFFTEFRLLLLLFDEDLLGQLTRLKTRCILIALMFEKRCQTGLQLMLSGCIDRESQFREDRMIREMMFVERRTISTERMIGKLIARDVDRIEQTDIQWIRRLSITIREENELER